MDTKTLVVGQDVYINSGCYGGKGKVVKITPWGVEVQISYDTLEVTPSGTEVRTNHYLMRFDSNGKGCDEEGTYECGPWYIDDMPFTERTALLEQAAPVKRGVVIFMYRRFALGLPS